MAQNISLAYQDGKSDKVYHAQVVKHLDGYIVNFQFGRRGSTLQTGCKTKIPVDLTKAETILADLAIEKIKKGYKPVDGSGDSTMTTVAADVAGRQSGLIPQLLNPIDREEALRLVADDDWMMQEKKDGVRLMVRVAPPFGTVTASNRKGQIVPISTVVEEKLKLMCHNFVVDGELIGDVYWIFDLLEVDGEDLRGLPALQRWDNLFNTFGIVDQEGSAIRIVKNYESTGVKEAAFQMLESERAEGVVFKLKNATSVPGRPNSGGNQLKFKFKGSATCMVMEQNGSKRSVRIAVAKGAQAQTIGNVTITANYEIPDPNVLIEVEYLYAYPDGSLFQPVYKGPRPDKNEPDEYHTLKFKQGTTDEDEA
jgi:bifunctional non-homologous end joining protein LigD